LILYLNEFAGIVPLSLMRENLNFKSKYKSIKRERLLWI